MSESEPTATIIDGKAVAAEVRAGVADDVTALQKDHDFSPGLAVVLVGEDAASAVYVRNKGRATIKAGMQSFEHRLPADTSEADLIDLVRTLNQDDAIDGILVQLPLPDHIDELHVIDAIDPAKDVDGLHVISAGRLMSGMAGLVPCTPLGCMELIRRNIDSFEGKRALVIGRSKLVGKPLAFLLLQENCTVTIAHSRTIDLAEECRRADILVVAVGRPEFVEGDCVKPGAIVIDVGINRVPTDDGKGRLVGDVNFTEASRVAGAITPVPGGVGPMTIAQLLRNTVTAACLRRGITIPT